MKRTAAQEKAVYLRNQDILVSAAAGSGKTRVLIDRIVAMVSEEHISLEEMLVVTFTRAAAGELKDRLAKGLEDALQLAVAAGDQERIKFLRHQLTALPQANV
ncbi:MAG: UvrD-helicase domain-containing protein, partial [Peptococcus niger]